MLCGSLVYSAGYRHPAVLANTMATLDQIADGRVVLGLGGGWLEQEYQAYGLHYGSTGERLRMLGEYVQCVRGLLTQERTSFAGEFFTLRDAQCEPKPVQARLPIWIGGGGERVTLRLVALHADGWNVPFIPPEEWARKAKVLDEHCADVGRDPADIVKTVNVGMAFTEEELTRQFGRMANYVRPGVLSGSVAGDGRQGRRLRRRRRAVGDPRDPRTVRPRRPRTIRDRGRARRTRLMDDNRVRDALPVNRPYDGLVAEAYDCWLPPERDYEDRAFYRDSIERNGGPALELGCGNGRLLVGYRAAGLDVEGLDSSHDMLEICRSHARAAGVDVTLHLADWTTLALARRYATIYNPAGSFMLIVDTDDALPRTVGMARAPRARRPALRRRRCAVGELRTGVGLADPPQRHARRPTA